MSEKETSNRRDTIFPVVERSVLGGRGVALGRRRRLIEASINYYILYVYGVERNGGRMVSGISDIRWGQLRIRI